MAKAKRTPRKPKGLGDTVADAISKLPPQVITIGKEVKKKLKGSEDCGCNEDKEALNKFGSELLGKLFGKPVNLPTDAQIDFLNANIEQYNKTKTIDRAKGREFVKIYDHIFNTTTGSNVPCFTGCNNAPFAAIMEKLNKYYNEWE